MFTVACGDSSPSDPGSGPGTPPPECSVDADCAASATGPLCDAGACAALPEGDLIGWRDGTPASVDITEIYRPTTAWEATDLDFHPERNELWVVSRRFEVAGVCSQSNFNSPRCRSLGSVATVIFNPGAADQRADTLEDDNSWHFMRRAPAMAMGVKDAWATCGEAATGNFEDDPVNYMGPTLWSSDLKVFAQPSGGNGSHFDMLHATPFCMGVAHEKDNVYWFFNGEFGAIDRVDFAEDHGPGADDHSDGIIFRYVKGQLARRENVPSHMEFNHDDNHLYIVDGGNSRVVKLDTTSGTPGGFLNPVYEPLADSGEYRNAVLTDVVSPGMMQEPSGLALHDDILYITDHATSVIHAYDIVTGTEVRRLDTGLPIGTLAGVTVGPDEKLYFVDMLGGAVYRIDPK